MNKVLFVNHRQVRCGVQQFGRRIFDLVKDSKNVTYFYLEAESVNEYLSAVNYYQPEYIVYNWHRGTMPWLSEDLITSRKDIKHYFIYHEEFTRTNYDKYLFFGDYDFSGGTKFGDKKVLLPRPLLEYSGSYIENSIPTIGSFGFGFWQKGYHTLTKLVNDTFDRAILNYHMPYSFFGDPLHEQTNAVEKACLHEITNPGIKLRIYHTFLDDIGVLRFLAGNDINVFLYGENGEGISSVIDYALSVKRPIAVSDSRMFRHILKDDIWVGRNSIQDIISKGTTPLEQFYSSWSITRFKECFDKEFINAS
jgi:hypothetical protein